MANAAALTIPSLSAAAVSLESDVTANSIGTVWLALPTPKVNVFGVGSGLGALALPSLTVVAVGTTSLVGTAALVLPTPIAKAQGFVASVGTVATTLPALTMLAGGGSAASLTLPVPTVFAAGVTGRLGQAALTLPALTLVASGTPNVLGQSTLALPSLVFESQGLTGNVGRMAASLTRLALAANGVTGNIGTAILTLPVLSLAAQGYGQALGTVQLRLPMLVLQAVGYANGDIPDASDGDVQPAIVMQTETGALSHYTNYGFNSFARFNNVFLGSNSEGVFVLTGDTDAGTVIDAAARVGTTDFGSSYEKRVDRCYVGYRTDGDMVLRVFTDEVNVRDYIMHATGRRGLHGNHTRIGKGLGARYWQFEIQNVNGAYFEMNAIELKPTHLRRRIGGGDA